LVRQLTQLISGKLQMHWYRSRWVVWQQCHMGVPQTIGGLFMFTQAKPLTAHALHAQ